MKVLKAPQSGSLAGTTASRNRFGQYERNRRAPVQPIGNGRRSTIRAYFKNASSAFSSLTGAQIAAWNAAGLAHPRVDSLGQTIKLTGQMLYVAINTSLQNIDQPLVTDPPADWSIAPLGSIKVVGQPNAIMALLPDGVPANTTMLVAASRPVAGGVSFMKTFVQFGYVVAGMSGADFTSAYIAQFGVPAVGQKIFFRLTPVNEDGVTGAPVILSDKAIAPTVIAAPVNTSVMAGQLTVTYAALGTGDVMVWDNTTAPDFRIVNNYVTDSPSPTVFGSLTTGDKYNARVSDGISWSPVGNDQVIM